MYLQPFYPLITMRARTFILIACLAPAFAAPSVAQDPAPTPAQTDADKSSLLDRVLINQKMCDRALELYERVERVEQHKTSGDPSAADVKTSRVVPAGTGVDHIPIGPDGKPANADAYHTELVKLEKALSWAADDGHAQHDAYEKIAKKHKERDDLIDATRTAFIFTFVGQELRGDRMLSKYSMTPNPAFHPNSRSTAIFAKVRGFVWIDDQSNQLARVEGEVIEDISVGLFLAKVNKGSHFMQERYEFAPGLWFPSFSQYDFDGRKFFSSFSFHERTFYSKYRRIGPPKEALEAIRQDPTSDSAHYRLAQVYRDLNKLDLATQELGRYQELSRLRQEELKQSRSVVKQFVLSQGAKPNN